MSRESAKRTKKKLALRRGVPFFVSGGLKKRCNALEPTGLHHRLPRKPRP